MKTIEDLKMRRLNQLKDQSSNINDKRDDIIKRIQDEIINQKHWERLYPRYDVIWIINN